jgi:hypothetical protein
MEGEASYIVLHRRFQREYSGDNACNHLRALMRGPTCSRTLVTLPRDRLALVGHLLGLGRAHVGSARSFDSLCLVLALFSSCSVPNLLGDWPDPPWAHVALRNMVLRFVSLHILNVSMYSINALLQMAKHQNLQKLLVLKPYV